MFTFAVLITLGHGNAGCFVDVDLSGFDAGPTRDGALATIDAACAQGSWWDEQYSHRQMLSFGDTSLVDFPTLVTLTPQHFDYAASQPDGRDVRFVSASGVELPHEIEAWSAGGTSTLWLRPATTDEHVYLYYGNPTVADNSRPTDVWADDFGAVWHFSEVGGALLDSTGNVSQGTVTGTLETTSGFLGGALRFDGTNFIEFEPSAALSSTDITLEAVVRLDDPTTAGFQAIVEHGRNGSNWYGLWKANTAPTAHFRWANTEFTNYSGPLAAATDHYLAATFDSGSGAVTTYIDGAIDRVMTTETTPVAQLGSVLIGAAALNPINEFFAGSISEVRISTTARSSAWIAAQQQALAGTLLSFAGTEALCVP